MPLSPPRYPLRTPRVLFLFCLLSFSGTAARLFLSELAKSSYWASVNPAMITNMVGSAVAGLLVGRGSSLSVEHGFEADAHYALMLGFCSCCTTFGTTMTHAAMVLATPEDVALPDPPGGGSWNAWADSTFSLAMTFFVSFSSYRLLHPFGSSLSLAGRLPASLCLATLLMPLAAGAVYVCVKGGVNGSLSSLNWGRVASVLASPLGSIPRALLSSWLNSNGRRVLFMSNFGTFLCNVLGTFICASMTYVVLDDGFSISLYAVNEGISGSLSTVSTYVCEVEKEKTKAGVRKYTMSRDMYVYVVATFGVGLASGVLGLKAGGL